MEVFGSFRTRLYLPTSDIDIMILGNQWENPPLRLLERELIERGVCDQENVRVLDKASVCIHMLSYRCFAVKIFHMHFKCEHILLFLCTVIMIYTGANSESHRSGDGGARGHQFQREKQYNDLCDSECRHDTGGKLYMNCFDMYCSFNLEVGCQPFLLCLSTEPDVCCRALFKNFRCYVP